MAPTDDSVLRTLATAQAQRQVDEGVALFRERLKWLLDGAIANTFEFKVNDDRISVVMSRD